MHHFRKTVHANGSVASALLLSVAASALAGGCGDPFESCEAHRSCPTTGGMGGSSGAESGAGGVNGPGRGGESGAGSGGTPEGGASGSSGGETGSGGDGVAGNSGASHSAGAGGSSSGSGEAGAGGEQTSAGAGGGGANCHDGTGPQCDCTDSEERPCGQCKGGTQTCEGGVWAECVDKLSLSANGSTLLCVPGGTFTMGGADLDDANPVHPVTLPSFWVDETEVTVTQYRACVEAGACPGEATANRLRLHESDNHCTLGGSGTDNFPMNCIDVDLAAAFCAWADKRLPTEEEWEFSARGSDGRLYVWGNSATGSNANWNSMGPVAVKAFPKDKSPFGIYDLAGNVREWTSTQRCRYTATGIDPNTCDVPVIHRGGSWIDSATRALRAALRHYDVPPIEMDDLGFRCAKSVLP